MAQAEVLAVPIPADGTLPSASWSFLYGLVDAATASRCRAFRNPEDALRTLMGRALALLLISRRISIAPSRIAFSTSPSGKPGLAADVGQNLQFNIAHSGHWVVAALDHEPVGIDIEQITGIGPESLVESSAAPLVESSAAPMADALLEPLAAVLSDEERRAVTRIMLRDGRRAAEVLLFTIWTAKESYLKCLGVGITDTGAWRPRRLTVRLSGENISLLQDGTPDTAQRVLRLQGFEGYSCCVCLGWNRPMRAPEYLTLAHLIAQLRALG